MQGPHHVAQNSITYNLSGSSAVIGFGPCSHVAYFMGGAGSPIFNVGTSWALTCPAQIIIIDNRARKRFMFISV
jgi:hypothetical protein